MDDLALPERHLGLVQAEETPQLDALLDGIADRVEAACDLERILASAPPPTMNAPPAAASGCHSSVTFSTSRSPTCSRIRLCSTLCCAMPAA